MKIRKNTWRYYHFIHVYHTWQSYDVWFLRYGAWLTQLFIILDHFLHLYPPNNPENQNFEKMKKNAWRYHHFTHVYHKWQSYDVWLLRYGKWWIQFFVILDHFLPFYSPNNLKNQNFETMKTVPGDITILYMCTINDNNMMYSSGDIERDEHNSLSF